MSRGRRASASRVWLQLTQPCCYRATHLEAGRAQLHAQRIVLCTAGREQQERQLEGRVRRQGFAATHATLGSRRAGRVCCHRQQGACAPLPVMQYSGNQPTVPSALARIQKLVPVHAASGKGVDRVPQGVGVTGAGMRVTGVAQEANERSVVAAQPGATNPPTALPHRCSPMRHSRAGCTPKTAGVRGRSVQETTYGQRPLSNQPPSLVSSAAGQGVAWPRQAPLACSARSTQLRA